MATIRPYVKGKYVYEIVTEETVERRYTVVADTPVDAIDAMVQNHWEGCEVTEMLNQRVLACKELQPTE
jgi:hypothetical protein